MSEKNNVMVRITCAASNGITSTGEQFDKTCSRMGLHVSVIRNDLQAKLIEQFI